jgi:hypothetical protein
MRQHIFIQFSPCPIAIDHAGICFSQRPLSGHDNQFELVSQPVESIDIKLLERRSVWFRQRNRGNTSSFAARPQGPTEV